MASPGIDPMRPKARAWLLRAKLAKRCCIWPSSTYFWAKSCSSLPLRPLDWPMLMPFDRVLVSSSDHTLSVKLTAFMKFWA